MPELQPVQEGQILTGALFNEPMRVEIVRSNGPDTWELRLVGLRSEKFRKVNLTTKDLASLTIQDTSCSYDGDGQLLRLGLQAYALGIAYEFDPYFGLSISRVDPLPHQLEAIYDYLLKLARVRRARAIGFLMALYQRRLASSTYALRHSLENRARRLDDGLKRARELARLAPVDLPDPEEFEEMEEAERERLEEKLQEIRDALDDDAVFNVVGEVLPAAQVERVLREFDAGRLGEVDLEDRLLKNVDERQFRNICQNALEGLAAKRLNLEMLIERRTRAQERRVAEDRRDCYWLYVVTNCNSAAKLQEPIKDPARFPWHEVKKVEHYYLSVDALTQPMRVQERPEPYGKLTT